MQIDYGNRIYDPHLGRFKSVDPIVKSYPWYSPYQFSGNNPIRFIDLDGKEIFDPFFQWLLSDAAITISSKPTSVKAKVYGAAMGVGGSIHGAVKGPINLVTHFDQSVKGIWRMVTNTPVENIVDNAINMGQTYGDLPQPVQDYAIYGHLYGDMVMLAAPFKGIFKTGSLAKVDLMGGAASSLGKDWINFDKAALTGITDDITNFSKHFAKASVKEIVANNPRAEFLKYVRESLRDGGTITVRGQMSNKFFKEIWDETAEGMEGYEVLEGSKKTGLSIKGYVKSDGTPLTGKPNSLNEIILKKKKK